MKSLSYDTLERIRHVAEFSETQWQELLDLSWWDYTLIRTGQRRLSERSLLRLSDELLYSPERLLLGEIDYQGLQIQAANNASWVIPESYAYATYGRRRTTITTFEYIEKYHGWKLRYDVLKHLGLSESVLQDPFATISMRVISDAMTYLAKRHFKAKDFFAMGLYSYVGNANTILGRHYGQMETPKEIIEHMWSDCLKFYEKNCRYRFLRLDEQSALLEVTSEREVADEMKVKHLGNEHICHLKAGMMASAPMYLGHAQAHVVEKCCAHKGAQACVFEITFANHGLI